MSTALRISIPRTVYSHAALQLLVPLLGIDRLGDMDLLKCPYDSGWGTADTTGYR